MSFFVSLIWFLSGINSAWDYIDDDKEMTTVRLVLGELAKSKIAVHECEWGLEQSIKNQQSPCD